jgi:hypothetical protein
VKRRSGGPAPARVLRSTADPISADRRRLGVIENVSTSVAVLPRDTGFQPVRAVKELKNCDSLNPGEPCAFDGRGC